MATIVIYEPRLTAETGLTLELRELDGTLVNSGGDAMTEDPAGSGRFTATVAEDLSALGLLVASVVQSSVSIGSGWLPQGETIVRAEYPDERIDSIHKAGETRRYTQIASNDGNKTADVSIGDPL
jgi:hypothetical protein